MGFSYSAKLFGSGGGGGSSTVSVGLATLGSQSKAITDATPTAFATIAISDGATHDGEILYSVRAVDGTNLQRLKGRAQWSATREAAVYTVSISEMGIQTLAAAAGTLTGAITLAGAAGVVTFSADFNSSQATPVLTLKYRFDSTDADLVVTPL